MRHLLDIMDLSVAEIDELIATANDIIARPAAYADACAGKKLATLFFEPSTRTRLSFEAAMLDLGGKVLGYLGQIHPLVAKNYGIDGEIYCAELDLTDAFALRLPDPTYHPLPKYPGVSRDLAIVCDENITVAQAEAVISAAGGKLLRSVKLFDVYRGIGVPENKKSLAFSLELRADDRTLTDADSEGTVAKILAALAE